MQNRIQTSEIHSTLRRVAEANHGAKKGQGIKPGDFIPIADFHNRSVAAGLMELLRENGIRVKAKAHRMVLRVAVAFEDRHAAYALRDDYLQKHPDTRLQGFTRDYDLVILLALPTLVIAAAYYVMSVGTGGWTVVAVLTSGASAGLIAERLHRIRRYYGGLRFTILELLLLSMICAVNLAMWRWALS